MTLQLYKERQWKFISYVREENKVSDRILYGSKAVHSSGAEVLLKVSRYNFVFKYISNQLIIDNIVVFPQDLSGEHLNAEQPQWKYSVGPFCELEYMPVLGETQVNASLYADQFINHMISLLEEYHYSAHELYEQIESYVKWEHRDGNIKKWAIPVRRVILGPRLAQVFKTTKAVFNINGEL